MLAFPTRLRRVMRGRLTAISARSLKRLDSSRRIPALGADGLLTPLLEGIVRLADRCACEVKVNAVRAEQVELPSFAAPYAAAELVRCGVDGPVDPVFPWRKLHSGEEGEEEAAEDGEPLERASAAVDVCAVLAVFVSAIGVEVVQRSLHVLGRRRYRL